MSESETHPWPIDTEVVLLRSSRPERVAKVVKQLKNGRCRIEGLPNVMFNAHGFASGDWGFSNAPRIERKTPELVRDMRRVKLARSIRHTATVIGERAIRSNRGSLEQLRKLQAALDAAGRILEQIETPTDSSP